ncbi:hypothetical protein GCM10011529_27110 [Polymorphobacter glacialis]|uniref:Uncharacterized protein n=1 Tax=Sandarakinorhabdus glacialis TaxID=1614636 RepID=A0A917A0H8_9SPHN|nr:hypothetical protein GCM10011529_27110 [Polymorphobacter glacialis]
MRRSHRGIENVEQFDEGASGVGAIGLGVEIDQLEENVLGLENAGVVGEQAEQQADQQAFEIMTGVAAILQRIVEAAHQLGGLDVDAGLGGEAALAAEDEGEGFDVLVKFREGEMGVGAGFEVEQVPALKIAGQDVAWLVAIIEPVDVIECLAAGLFEVEAGAFLFDEQLAGPEQIDEAGAGFIEGLDALFIRRDGAALDAEDGEEFVVEGLGVAFFIGRGCPFGGEIAGSRGDDVPTQSLHKCSPGVW